MKITLPNGAVLEGDEKQIDSVMKSLGYIGTASDLSNYYYSKSTDSYLLIKTMPTPHLMNAVLKEYREWVSDLSKETDPRILHNRILDGPSSKSWISMVAQLALRA